VSKCTSYLEEELRHYQQRPLTDDVEFLFLDGIIERVRDISVGKRVMLCAYGIHAGGHKEILSFRMSDVEDFASWRGFLVDLKSRGLLGKRLKLITTDGNPALLKALKEIYPFIKRRALYSTQAAQCSGQAQAFSAGTLHEGTKTHVCSQ